MKWDVDGIKTELQVRFSNASPFMKTVLTILAVMLVLLLAYNIGYAIGAFVGHLT